MAATSALLCLIQNPAAVLRPEEELEVVRYPVRTEAWQRHAQPFDNESWGPWVDLIQVAE